MTRATVGACTGVVARAVPGPAYTVITFLAR